MTTTRTASRIALVAALAAVLAGCSAGPAATAPPASAPETTSAAARRATPAATREAAVAPAAHTAAPAAPPAAAPSTPRGVATRPATKPTKYPGAPSARCRSGWRTATASNAWVREAMALAAAQSGAPGPLVLDDARIFWGPDVPEILEPRFEHVDMAYLKVHVEGRDYRGRFVVTSKDGGRRAGIAAVAAYATHGYSSPDWSQFVGESDGGVPTPRPGLPGSYVGLQSDAITGQPYAGFGSLDRSVHGCLDRT